MGHNGERLQLPSGRQPFFETVVLKGDRLHIGRGGDFKALDGEEDTGLPSSQ